MSRLLPPRVKEDGRAAGRRDPSKDVMSIVSDNEDGKLRTKYVLSV